MFGGVLFPAFPSYFPAVYPRADVWKSVNVSMFFPSLPNFFSICISGFPISSQVFLHIFPRCFSICSHVFPYFLHLHRIFPWLFPWNPPFLMFFFPRFSHVFRWLPHVFNARFCRCTTCWTWRTWPRRWAELVGGTQRQNTRGFLWIFPWF